MINWVHVSVLGCRDLDIHELGLCVEKRVDTTLVICRDVSRSRFLERLGLEG